MILEFDNVEIEIKSKYIDKEILDLLMSCNNYKDIIHYLSEKNVHIERIKIKEEDKN